MTEEKLSRQQMKSLNFWCGQISIVLRQEGMTMNKVIEIMKNFELPPTKEVVKELVFKPIMTALFKKTSTTELCRKKEIDDISQTMIMNFGKWGITLPPFPSEEEIISKQREEEDKKQLEEENVSNKNNFKNK